MDELHRVPNQSLDPRPRAQTRVMAKGKGIPLCLGCLFSCCALSSALLVGLALLLKFAEVPLIDDQVTEQMVIKKGSVLYNQLQNPGLPLWKSFYFYNLTNYEAWAAGQELPHVQEVGPYSFREKRTKYIQSVEDDVLVYNQTKYFYWDGENSHPDALPSDIICTINIPLVAGIAKVENDAILRAGLTYIIWKSKAHMYICQEAKNLAWNYTDDLVKELHSWHQYPRTYVNIQVNGSSNDSLHSAINTGAVDIRLLGNLITWDGHFRNLSTWPGGDSNPANRIRGNEGLFFRPLLKEGDNLTAFIDDVQRSFDLTYVGKVKHLNTLAYRFEVVNSTWQNATVNPYNANFGSDCPEGLIYLGPTQYPEIPVYGSKAHFLDGDPALRDCCVNFSEPNRTLHDITLDVEPITGANIQVKQILQINVQVQKSAHFDETKKLRGYNFNNSQTLYFPVMWVSEHAELNSQFQQYLDDQGLTLVEVVEEAVPILFWILIGLAVLCALISMASCVGYTVRARRRMREQGNSDETARLLPPRRY